MIRALEPIEGMEKMAELRYKKPLYECNKREYKDDQWLYKLCQAMGINKDNNGQDLCGNKLFLKKAETPSEADIVTTTRINIGYAEEAIHFPYRFYINSSPYVSVRIRS